MEKKYKLWDLKNNKTIEEPIYGEDFLRFCYENPYGRILSKWVFTKRPINNLYALYKKSKFSKKQIQTDIKNYQINMDEFQEIEFKNFRDFFLRKFKAGKRNFPTEENFFGAFCEGKYLSHQQVSNDIKYPVKGTSLSPKELLQNETWSHQFENGSIIIARLCPADYHYFHFPDSGEIIESYQIPGSLESVSNYTLSQEPDVFLLNERRVNILKTKNFGLLAYVEVGAMVVGRICQTHQFDTFLRGEEKGYFDFGGSTVIVLTQKDKVKIDPTILENSKNNFETQVQLGYPIAQKIQE